MKLGIARERFVEQVAQECSSTVRHFFQVSYRLASQDKTKCFCEMYKSFVKLILTRYRYFCKTNFDKVSVLTYSLLVSELNIKKYRYLD